MNWETFKTRCKDHQYFCDIDFNQALHIIKKKYHLIEMMSPSFKATYFIYLSVIYILRLFSLIALPVSLYYDVVDWWFGLFGWILSDYLFYDLGNTASEELKTQAQEDEGFYTAIRHFEKEQDLPILILGKTSSQPKMPLHKKLITIFLR